MEYQTEYDLLVRIPALLGRRDDGTGDCPSNHIPVVALLNKEYVGLAAKLRWLSDHCVTAAFTVHHDALSFSTTSGIPFHRISFASSITDSPSSIELRAGDQPARRARAEILWHYGAAFWA
jgi:hypothetical protein